MEQLKRWKEGLKPVLGERNKTFEKGFTSLHQGIGRFQMLEEKSGKEEKIFLSCFILFLCCTGHA